jgi:hypothetical protein
MKTLIYTVLTICILSACQKEDLTTDKMASSIKTYSIKITNHSKTIDKAALMVAFEDSSMHFVNDTAYFHMLINNILVDSLKKFNYCIGYGNSRLMVIPFNKFKIGFCKSSTWYFCKDWIDSNIPDYIISPETIWVNYKGETLVVKD